MKTAAPKCADLMTFIDAEEPNAARIIAMMNSAPDQIEPVEKPRGEGWLVNGEQQLLTQFRPDTTTAYGQWVELRTYKWVRPQPPVPQNRRKLSKTIAIETWKHMVKVGWRRCSPPVR